MSILWCQSFNYPILIFHHLLHHLHIILKELPILIKLFFEHLILSSFNNSLKSCFFDVQFFTLSHLIDNKWDHLFLSVLKQLRGFIKTLFHWFSFQTHFLFEEQQNVFLNQFIRMRQMFTLSLLETRCIKLFNWFIVVFFFISFCENDNKIFSFHFFHC